jgi:L,D-peptidoglycan transpeptidase YkuD (ErfK/YbiS/YcfS/YnhG family)
VPVFLIILAALLPPEADRLVMVRAPGWDASEGQLVRYQRDPAGWHPVGKPVPVALGGKGLAWGLGIAPAPSSGPQKQEGDGRTPAGLFAVGEGFGYDDRPEGVELPWRRVVTGDVCVDDPASRHYNRLVAAAVEKDWRSAEPMRRYDDLYRFGAVIAHNPEARSGAGSCIFFHLWRRRGSATVGCVAMGRPELRALLRWMKPGRTLVAILPDEAYAAVGSAWGLPDAIKD